MEESNRCLIAALFCKKFEFEVRPPPILIWKQSDTHLQGPLPDKETPDFYKVQRHTELVRSKIELILLFYRKIFLCINYLLFILRYIFIMTRHDSTN